MTPKNKPPTSPRKPKAPNSTRNSGKSRLPYCSRNSGNASPYAGKTYTPRNSGKASTPRNSGKTSTSPQNRGKPPA